MRLEMLLFTFALSILVLVCVTPSDAIHVTRVSMHRHMDEGVNDNKKVTINKFGSESIDQLAVNVIKDAPLLSILRAAGRTICQLPDELPRDPKAPKAIKKEPPKSEKKLKDKNDVKNKLLEINSEGELSGSGSGSGSGFMQITPVGPMTLAAGAEAHRIQIRGGKTDNTAAHFGYTIGANVYPTFPDVYQIDWNGRVIDANLFVGAGWASNPGALAVMWCDVVWNHLNTNGWCTEGNTNARVRSEYHSGHIMAASHGGTNHDPLNFIPLHFQSNTNGGRWQRIEMIATAVKGRAGPAATTTAVDIMFLYNDDPLATINLYYPTGLPVELQTRPFVPIGGTYAVSVDDDIMRTRFRPTGAALTALIGPAAWTTLVGAPLIAWCTNNLSSLEAVFCKNAEKLPPTAAYNADRWVLKTRWKNVADIALAEPPGLGVRDPTRYVVQENLF